MPVPARREAFGAPPATVRATTVGDARPRGDREDDGGEEEGEERHGMAWFSSIDPG